MALKDVQDLAQRVINSLDRDLGYRILWDLGIPPEEIKKVSDEELMKLARDYAAMPKPKQTHCYECGQTLPDED